MGSISVGSLFGISEKGSIKVVVYYVVFYLLALDSEHRVLGSISVGSLFSIPEKGNEKVVVHWLLM